MKPFPWKIGELAAATGVTVRALHHYDDIGLLKPSGKTVAGYRLYAERDLLTLQQITTFRHLGFSLEKITTLLKEKHGDSAALLELQITGLRAQIATMQDTLERLDGLSRLVKMRSKTEPADLAALIRLLLTIESYHSPEDLAEIKERGRALGRDGIVKAETDWQTLIAEVKAEMEKGTPPGHARMRPLMQKWKSLVDAFTGGNQKIAENLRKMYAENPNAGRTFGGPDPAMSAYVDQAMKALKTQPSSRKKRKP